MEYTFGFKLSWLKKLYFRFWRKIKCFNFDDIALQFNLSKIFKI